MAVVVVVAVVAAVAVVAVDDVVGVDAEESWIDERATDRANAVKMADDSDRERTRCPLARL